MVDREDAELASRAVAQVDYVRKAMAPVTVAGLLLVLAWLVVGVVSGSTILIIGGTVGLGLGGIFDLLSRWQRRRHRQSTTATRRLHDREDPLVD